MRQYKPFEVFTKSQKIAGTRLTPLEIVRHGGVGYRCRCDCGKETLASHSDIRAGRKKSCGCLKNELACERVRTHGLSKRDEYFAAMNAFRRCTNPKDAAYRDYGGRGIKVEFKSAAEFTRWLIQNLPKPKGAFVLDRIDNNGNYSRKNIRWATRAESARNRRDNHVIAIGGVSKTIADWSKESGICGPTLLNRHRMKYPDGLILHKGKITKLALAERLFNA